MYTNIPHTLAIHTQYRKLHRTAITSRFKDRGGRLKHKFSRTTQEGLTGSKISLDVRSVNMLNTKRTNELAFTGPNTLYAGKHTHADTTHAGTHKHTGGDYDYVSVGCLSTADSAGFIHVFLQRSCSVVMAISWSVREYGCHPNVPAMGGHKNTPEPVTMPSLTTTSPSKITYAQTCLVCKNC